MRLWDYIIYDWLCGIEDKEDEVTININITIEGDQNGKSKPS